MAYGPVVVGVDDLAHSAHALTVAAREAEMREVPLWLVHAHSVIPPARRSPADGALEAAILASAGALLDEAAAFVRVDHPGLDMEIVPLPGAAWQVLSEACPDASLVVVGGRGRGGFAGLMLGSVSLRVVAHARGAVMVVRGDAADTTGRIVVGVDVDDPASGPDLLEFAFAEAELRNAAVHAVHAWDKNGVSMTTDGNYVTGSHPAVVADRDRRLDALLAPWREKFRAVSVSRQSISASPSRVLVDSSRLADLVVLGGRARGPRRDGIQAGALAHAVLHHAHCPVVIVPEHTGRTSVSDMQEAG